jgi:CMP-N-acetylneuraminic acid synthetase
VKFYKRPEHLGDNKSTSEDFIADFLGHVECDDLFQIHSITPLLKPDEIRGFVEYCQGSDSDTVISCIEDQIEVAFGGIPVNFSISEKTNSQELKPVQRITWAAAKWSRSVFLQEKAKGSIGTYSGKLGFYPVSTFSGLAIKTRDDLDVARRLWGHV